MFPQRRQTSHDLTSPATNTPVPAPVAAFTAFTAFTAKALTVATCLSVAVVWAAPAASAHDEGPTPATSVAGSTELRDAVEHRESDVDQAQDGVSAAALTASDALERYTLAIRSLDAARTEENARQDELAAAQQRLADARADLGRWARTAYAGGGAMTPGTPGFGLATVLRAKSTDDLGTTVAALHRVGRSRSRTIDAVAGAERDQTRAADAAAAAAKTAETAAVTASQARSEADVALQQQRELLAASETALADAERAVDVAAQRERERAAAEARARAGAGGGNQVTGPVGVCSGGDVDHYPNGRIPVEALCRLSAQPGHHLRADAASAFDTMSRAFTARFGTPICVTDSYRTYDEQVRLKALKPHLAATPGTSNHGWGTATDLCGGIQNFSTEEHRWMAANAPLHNWFHPSWARQGGSKPEPWHFEYAG